MGPEAHAKAIAHAWELMQSRACRVPPWGSLGCSKHAVIPNSMGPDTVTLDPAVSGASAASADACGPRAPQDVTSMIVSHDSGFLDAVCSNIIHYEGRKLRLYRVRLLAVALCIVRGVLAGISSHAVPKL